MKPIEYHGPFEEVEVEGLGLVTKGEAVEADDDLAGKPPKGSPGDKSYDPGEGLLAQADNWKPASKSAAKKAASADGSTDSQEG